MPSLVQLQYALAVADHRHFGHAAQACHVTQPTLSQQLQKLEDELGIMLFDRTKKPILPTPEGERFLVQAKVVLKENAKLESISKQMQGGELSGVFRLAVIPTVAADLLPLCVGALAKALPKVDLVIEEMKTETILSHLAEDRLDGAILATPISADHLKIHPLYYEPFFAYLSPGHPLQKSAALSKSDLEPREIWLLQDGHCLKDQVVDFCALSKTARSKDRAAKAIGSVQFQSGSLDTLMRLVRESRGSQKSVTVIPALAALALKKSERETHVRPFVAPQPTREVSFVYRRDHWKLKIISAIEATIQAHLPKGVATQPERSMRVMEVS